MGYTNARLADIAAALIRPIGTASARPSKLELFEFEEDWFLFRLQPLLFQPFESLVPYSLSDVLEEMRAAHFPGIDQPVEVRIAAEGPLAYIQAGFMGRGRHLVVFHPVLNHLQTPIEVIRFIAKHELTHITRPPRGVGADYEVHPPEFWEHEAAIGPERYAVWAWVHKNLNRCARNTAGRYRVGGKWRLLCDTPRTPYTPSLPFNGERWDRVCPGAGAQLRLPPDWTPRQMGLAS
jgi:hypothetical protein